MSLSSTMKKLAYRLAILHRWHVWSFHLLLLQAIGCEAITRPFGAPLGTGILCGCFSTCLWLANLYFITRKDFHDNNADRRPSSGSISRSPR